MEWLQEAGIFKAMPLESGVKTSKDTGSIAAEIRFKITDVYNATSEEWVDCVDRDLWVTGRFYVIGTDGTPNKHAVASLQESFGWDGTFESLANSAYRDRQVQITVDGEVFEDVMRYKVKWINHVDRPVNVGVGNADIDRVRGLDGQYGAELRAMIGAANEAAPAATMRPVVDAEDSKAVIAFGTYNVTREMIEGLIGKTVEQATPGDIANLKTIYGELQHGAAVETHFPRTDDQSTGMVPVQGDDIPF